MPLQHPEQLFLLELGERLAAAADAAASTAIAAEAIRERLAAHDCLVLALDGAEAAALLSPAELAELGAGQPVVRDEPPILAVPLVRAGTPVAVLAVTDTTPRAWKWLEVSTVRLAAERAWLAAERHRAASLAHASEQRYRRIVENAHEGIWEVDASYCTRFVNPRMAEMLGYAPHEMLGQPLAAFQDAESLMLSAERVARRRQGIAETHDLRFQRRDGSVLWARASSSPLFAADGEFSGAIAFISDLTAHHEADAKLRESEARKSVLLDRLTRATADLETRVQERTVELAHANTALGRSEASFRAMIEHAPFGLAVLQDVIVYANPHLCEMVGHTDATPLLGTDYLALAHPDDRAVVRLRMARVQSGIENSPAELRVLHATGRVIWCEVASIAIEYDGRPAVAVMFRNMTARRDAELRLKASLREKEVLLREIHHRVKNNLQVVSSLLYLQSRAVTDVAARAHLEASQARVRSIGLVHEHLYRAPDLSHVDVREYVEALVRNLAEALDAGVRHIALRCAVEPLLLSVDESVAVGLVISELVTNALKHAFPGRGGTIAVSLAQAGEAVTLRVADDGVGLPPGFEPARVGSLGLELVATFADQLRGRVQFEPGPGTAVAITFAAGGARADRS